MEYKLRKWQHSDLDKLVEYANNYNIARWLTDGFPYPYTKESGQSFLEAVVDKKDVHVFAIEINGEAAGSIGIITQTDIHCKNAEVGYWLAEKYWGNGIIPRAIKEMVDYGFENLNVTRIFARPFGNNKQSQRVLEKAGFVLEAQFKGTLFKNGEVLDECIYAIRKE